MKKKRFTEEQIAYALAQDSTGQSIAEICRKPGVSEQTFSRWKKQFGRDERGPERPRRLRAASRAAEDARRPLVRGGRIVKDGADRHRVGASVGRVPEGVVVSANRKRQPRRKRPHAADELVGVGAALIRMLRPRTLRRRDHDAARGTLAHDRDREPELVERRAVAGDEPLLELPYAVVPKPVDRRRPTEELPLERIAIRHDHRKVATHVDREPEPLLLIRLRGTKRADMHGRRGEGGGGRTRGDGKSSEARETREARGADPTKPGLII